LAAQRTSHNAFAIARRLDGYKWAQEEICAVIRFLRARHVFAAEIHRQLVEVYGEETMSRQSVAIGVQTSNLVELDNGW
jgi:hypothetical protein